MIAIDRANAGRARRHFFEKRFAAAAAHPEDFIHLGMEEGGTLCGFAFARLLRGEFGREQIAAVLDAVGVAAESRRRGIGRGLLRELIERLRGLGVRTLHSQAEWSDAELTRFLAASGFKLAPRLALERSVTMPLVEQSDDV
ncbi:MAG TPA: GNAT family N-acetyltransferase [Xanthobacteraceae bacterium]|nr:GNAT family N-acetyltransferase [Xanthobacteraceae bacterium]